jgi:methyl-accepting chemotaxis protein
MVVLLVVITTSIVAGAIGVTGLLSMVSQRNQSLETLRSALQGDYDQLIKSQVEAAIGVIEGVYERYEAGEFSEERAKELAAGLIRDLRYGEEGYFWIDTYEGDNVVLLGSETEGTNRNNLQDVQGTYLVQDIIAAGRNPGGGFTDYWFPRAGETEAAQKRGYSLAFEPWEWVLGTGNYVDDINASVAEYEAVLQADFRRVEYIEIGMLIAGILISMGIAIPIGRRLTRPIRNTAESLAEIAHGDADLSRRLEVVSKDEVGALAENYNQFIAGLSSIVRSIRKSTDAANHQRAELSSASTETAASAEQIAATVRSVSTQTESLSGEVDDTNAAVEEISRTITSLARQVENQASAVEQSSAAIEQMIASIRSIASIAASRSEVMERLQSTTAEGRREMSATDTKVESLSESVSEVLDVAQVISGIAARTNLLAMNAAIEAAHAGDSGRGFAVVADEIRKLAVSAAENSKSIGQTLKHNASEIKNLQEASSSAIGHYDEVEQAADETSKAFSEITSAMRELSSGAEEIQKAVSDLRETTSGVQGGSQEIERGANQVEKSSRRVQEVTRQVTDAMSQIDSGAAEISIAMQSLNDSVGRISELIAAIGNEVARFRDTEGDQGD